MRLKSKRGFLIKNEKRGLVLQVQKGEVFELDETIESEREQIYQILQANMALVIDENLIPVSGNYIACMGHTERKPDGSLLILTAGDTVTLDQETATRLLISGRVKREDESLWHPRNLIGKGIAGTGEVKKMFDEDPPPENWATKDHRVKGGHE